MQYFIQIPHIIFCCPLSAYDKWWFEQKKSPHFREKYLVLSYLKLQQESLWMSSSSKSPFSKHRHVQQNNFLEEDKLWKTTNLLFLISKIDVAKNAHRQDEETNTYQTQIAFSITGTRQEPRGLVGSSCDFGSSGARFKFHRGQLFIISPSLFFLFKVRTAKNFKVFHMFGDGLCTCAPANLSGGYYKNYKPPRRLLSGFTNLWPKYVLKWGLAIETSIKKI